MTENGAGGHIEASIGDRYVQRRSNGGRAMTTSTLANLNQDLETVMNTLRDIEKVVRALYDGDTAPTRRVGEAVGAVQRLIWAIERQPQGVAAGGSQ